MKIISFKALLLGATLALAGNSTLAAIDWQFSGVCAGIAAFAGWAANDSHKDAQLFKKLQKDKEAGKPIQMPFRVLVSQGYSVNPNDPASIAGHYKFQSYACGAACVMFAALAVKPSLVVRLFPGNR